MSTYFRDGTGISSWQGAGFIPGNSAFVPSGYKFETFGRNENMVGTVALGTTGQLTLSALWLPYNDPISTLAWMVGSTAAVTPTQQQMFLLDSAYQQIAWSTNKTTTAIPASSGASAVLSSFTLNAAPSANYTGLMFMALYLAAGTMPTATGIVSTTWTNAMNVPVAGTLPVLTDGVSTLNSTTFTSATAAFVAGDVGKAIWEPANTHIKANTVIQSVTNATTVVLSQSAAATGTAETFVIGRTPGQLAGVFYGLAA